MIGRDGPLSVSRQCALVGVSPSSLYHRPKRERAENLALMRRMDELHMAHPFYGSRQLMRHLRREGVTAGRHRIRSDWSAPDSRFAWAVVGIHRGPRWRSSGSGDAHAREPLFLLTKGRRLPGVRSQEAVAGRRPQRMKTTRYFAEQVLRKRPYLDVAWCVAVIESPLHSERQPDGRFRFWGEIVRPGETFPRVLRVVTLEDRETIHNAFFDRGFRRGSA